MTELVAEIDRAMSGPPTGDGWSCFISNKALSAFRARGPALLPAIEEVVRRFHFEDAQSFGEDNMGHLLLIYFETADDAGMDVSGFVRSLRGRHLEKVLLAIFHRGALRVDVRNPPTWMAEHAQRPNT
jgi:hypothetical protein